MKTIYETRLARVGETPASYSYRITSTLDACTWVRYYLADYFSDKLDQEELLVALLDQKHKVKRVVRVSRGTLNSSLVHPREVFRPAIHEAAAAIILIHNHPSGDPTPSTEDFRVTKRMEEAGELLGIRVLDHIVCGEAGCISIKAS